MKAANNVIVFLLMQSVDSLLTRIKRTENQLCIHVIRYLHHLYRLYVSLLLLQTDQYLKPYHHLPQSYEQQQWSFLL